MTMTMKAETTETRTKVNAKASTTELTKLAPVSDRALWSHVSYLLYFHARGRAAGYPECCVTWFSAVWVPMYLRGESAAMKAYLAESQKMSDGRIPCPKCQI